MPLNLGFLKGGSAKAGVNHGTMLWVGGNKVASGAVGAKEITVAALV